MEIWDFVAAWQALWISLVFFNDGSDYNAIDMAMVELSNSLELATEPDLNNAPDTVALPETNTADGCWVRQYFIQGPTVDIGRNGADWGIIYINRSAGVVVKLQSIGRCSTFMTCVDFSRWLENHGLQ